MVTLYYHVVDATTRKIFARNDSPNATRIPKRFNLGMVSEIQYGNCFQVTDCSMAMKPPGHRHLASPPVAQKSSSMPPCLGHNINNVVSLSTSQQGEPPLSLVPTHLPKPLTHDIPRVVPGIRAVKPLTLTGAKEEILPNGIKIYGFDTERQAYAKLVEEFPSLWKDDGFIKVPPEEWMRIPLKDGWQDKLTGRSKIYPLGIEDRKLVDETFDKMHEQGRLKWTDEETPFSFPVFVVWKLINGKRKGRAVADIRGLNDMIMPDAYPVPLQGDIINDLRGCDRLSVLDAMSFFYQWRVHSSDTFKLTIVTHRGQETFLVPVMGCRNSIA